MKAIIGIDEVGRGPIAGPVAVAAFTFKKKVPFRKTGLPLRDSKKLSKFQREAWVIHLNAWKKQGFCDFSVTMISAGTIDRIGIVPAIKKALEKSLYNLDPKFSYTILLDGGLKAPEEFKNQKTIIKGDEKEEIIAFASIVAKVTRDRHMAKQSKKFPAYGFDTHVGYGTKAHYSAIKKHGLTPIHRRSFLKKVVSP